MSQVRIKNLRDLDEYAKKLTQTLPQQCVVLLNGPMAAGKTELVKMFCQHMGITGVTSPTFALHQHYETEAIIVDHLDLFRVESEEELSEAGFWDLFLEDKRQVIFIEWPEKVDLDKISRPIVNITFFVNQNERTLKIT